MLECSTHNSNYAAQMSINPPLSFATCTIQCISIDFNASMCLSDVYIALSHNGIYTWGLIRLTCSGILVIWTHSFWSEVISSLVHLTVISFTPFQLQKVGTITFMSWSISMYGLLLLLHTVFSSSLTIHGAPAKQLNRPGSYGFYLWGCVQLILDAWEINWLMPQIPHSHSWQDSLWIFQMELEKIQNDYREDPESFEYRSATVLTCLPA